MRKPDERSLARRCLAVLLTEEGASELAERVDAEWLRHVSEAQVIVIRLVDTIGRHGEVPTILADAAEGERARIDETAKVIGRLGEACGATAIHHVFPKALQHLPDMGHDIDLLVSITSRRVDDEVLAGFQVAPGDDGLVNRIAGKSAYVIDGCPSPLEIHHGRMGVLGEEREFAEALIDRSMPVEALGQTIRVPSPEDQVLIQVFQRAYAHFGFRVGDILRTRKLVREDLDWDTIVTAARELGVEPGLRWYLAAVDAAATAASGAGFLEGAVMAAVGIRRRAASPRLDVPSATVARLLLRRAAADVRARRWHRLRRFMLIPPVGVVVAARQTGRRASRLTERVRASAP